MVRSSPNVLIPRSMAVLRAGPAEGRTGFSVEWLKCSAITESRRYSRAYFVLKTGLSINERIRS